VAADLAGRGPTGALESPRGILARDVGEPDHRGEEACYTATRIGLLRDEASPAAKAF
jgi:hypothetical protein